mgnify:CR=1 FL=1
MAAKYQHLLSDIAHQLKPKMRPAVLKTSFKKFLAVMPEAEDHVELVGSVRISVSGEVIPGAAQRGCPLYLRCSMPDLMR